MSQKDPSKLFSRFQSGDPLADRAIYEKYHSLLLLAVCALTHQNEAAEDIVAESFFILFSNRDKIKDAAHIRGYLFVVAKNRAIGFLRSQKRHRVADEKQMHFSATEYVDPNEIEKEIAATMEKVCRWIERLPPAQKKSLNLRFFEGLDYRTIAKRLNKREVTVRNQCNLALIALRKAFIG